MMKKGEWTVALFISLTTDAVTCAIAGVVGGKARYYWMRITPSERILPGEAVSLKLDSISNED